MTESRLVSEWGKLFVYRSSVTGRSRVLQIAAVIFGEDRQCCSVMWQATGERSFFSAGRELSVCGRLPKRARKNISWEEDGINAFCPLIGQCVAESLGGGIDSREKLDLWLLQSCKNRYDSSVIAIFTEGWNIRKFIQVQILCKHIKLQLDSGSIVSIINLHT